MRPNLLLSFGHYAIEKLVRVANDEQRCALLEDLAPHVVGMHLTISQCIHSLFFQFISYAFAPNFLESKASFIPAFAHHFPLVDVCVVDLIRSLLFQFVCSQVPSVFHSSLSLPHCFPVLIVVALFVVSFL